MLEVYSINQTLNAGSAVPLNITSIAKGVTAVLASPSTIELNKCGVYMVSMDASIEPSAAGEFSIQLTKDGLVQPQAQVSATGAAETITPVSFQTLVQVPSSNSCRCCDSPTFIQFLYNGEGVAVAEHFNVVVTKLC